MPADNGVWLDQDQRLSPCWPQPLQSDPKQSVGLGKLRLRMTSRQDRELLPQGEIL